MMYLALSILMILLLTKMMFSIHKQLTHIPIFHRTTTTSATTITRFTTNPTSVYLQPCFTSPSQCILSTPALRQPALLAPVCPPGSRRPGKRPPAATRPPGFHPPGRSASALQRSCWAPTPTCLCTGSAMNRHRLDILDAAPVSRQHMLLHIHRALFVTFLTQIWHWHLTASPKPARPESARSPDASLVSW